MRSRSSTKRFSPWKPVEPTRTREEATMTIMDMRANIAETMSVLAMAVPDRRGMVVAIPMPMTT